MCSRSKLKKTILYILTIAFAGCGTSAQYVSPDENNFGYEINVTHTLNQIKRSLGREFIDAYLPEDNRSIYALTKMHHEDEKSTLFYITRYLDILLHKKSCLFLKK